MDNKTSLLNFRFLEWATNDISYYGELFASLGLSPLATFPNTSDVIWYSDNIFFLVTTQRPEFVEQHGPGVSGIGFGFKDAHASFDLAVLNGCEVHNKGYLYDNFYVLSGKGIDGCTLYFLDDSVWHRVMDATTFQQRPRTMDCGLYRIDHITHNCKSGNMDVWAENYKNWFGMYQNKYFDIDGKSSGLISKAMMVPTNHIAIPLNEDKDGTGQIAQFIKEFNGEGVQHIAMETSNIYTTIRKLRDNGVEFLEVPDSYYSMVSNRIDEHRENINDLQELGILIDGSKEDGILLQLFTKPVVGPVFLEVIQRKRNQGFGHGNFQALFEAMEQEQIGLQ